MLAILAIIMALSAAALLVASSNTGQITRLAYEERNRAAVTSLLSATAKRLGSDSLSSQDLAFVNEIKQLMINEVTGSYGSSRWACADEAVADENIEVIILRADLGDGYEASMELRWNAPAPDDFETNPFDQLRINYLMTKEEAEDIAAGGEGMPLYGESAFAGCELIIKASSWKIEDGEQIGKQSLNNTYQLIVTKNDDSGTCDWKWKKA